MTISQTELNQQLKSAGIGINATELHGFLSGLICGGLKDQSWLPLLYQFSNDNHAYPTSLIQPITEIYEQLIVNRGCHIHIVRTQQNTLYFSVIGFLTFDICADMKGKKGDLILIDIHMKTLH